MGSVLGSCWENWKETCERNLNRQAAEHEARAELLDAHFEGRCRNKHRDNRLTLSSMRPLPKEFGLRFLAEPTHIIDGIWLGGVEMINDPEFFKVRGITDVLSICAQEPEFDGFKDLMYSTRFEKDIRDTEAGAEKLFGGEKPLINDIVRWMQAARCDLNSVIFVHCAKGISRSATVVIAYLVLCVGASVDEAFDFIKARRACVQPNKHFMRGLRAMTPQ